MYEDNNYYKSSMSEARNQIQRINELQTFINISNFKLFQINEETGQFFYQDKFVCLNNLFSEIKHFFNNGERQECFKIKELIEKIIAVKMPYYYVVDNSFMNSKRRKVENLENQNTIRNVLSVYEHKIRDLLGKYEISITKQDMDMR